jgi:hypothetical protein
MVKVGLCGFRKSGNYLNFRILKAIMIELGIWNSYNLYSNCWSTFFQPQDLAFPEELEVDEVLVDERTVILYKGPHRLRYETKLLDLNLFNRKSSLVWTHQAPKKEHFDFFEPDRKWIYVLRDGREVINSFMHFLVTPVLLKRHPEYKINDVKELYAISGYVEKHIKWWKEDIDAFMRLQDRYLLIRYEDLTSDKSKQIIRILDYLGVTTEINLDAILKETSFDSMKKDAPIHVRKGHSKDWKKYFSDQHIKSFKEIAGKTLIDLGYEKNNDW